MYQFPIVVCFAATTHKFLGATVHKPNKLAVDLRTVFDDAMAYVMLSRVQDKNQLFIVGSLPSGKFRTSIKCLEELERLTKRSENRNPPLWEQISTTSIKISVLNCHSLADKIRDIQHDTMLRFSDVICLTETWLKDDTEREDLELKGYKFHANSFGALRGKGVVLYFEPEKFEVFQLVKTADLQVSCLSSPDLDVIAVYRSADRNDAFDKICSHIVQGKAIIICGDFNLCYNERRSHKLIQSILSLGFKQKVLQATHIKGGMIDHVYFREGEAYNEVEVTMYSPYYTAEDHDALCMTLTRKS